MKPAVALLAALAALLPAAPAADPPAGPLLVRADAAHVGTGAVLKGGVRLLVRDGRIEALLPDSGPAPAGYRVVDARGRVLLPGLVAARTLMAAQGDGPPLLPDLEAFHALDRFRYRPEILRGGITALHIAPGRDRFLPGTGSLVRLAPKGGSLELLRERADLFLVLGEAGKTRALVYDPPYFPDENHPLQPALRLAPGSLAAQGALARRLFGLAAASEAPALFKQGPIEFQLAGLRAVLDKKTPLRIVVDGPASLALGLDLARQLGLAPLVEDGRSGLIRPEEYAVLSPAAVIVALPMRLWAPNPGDPQETPPWERPDLGAAARLHKAGIPVILAPASDQDLDGLLLAAGAAIRAGLEPAAALRALTLEPARAFGLEGRIGSLQPGRDADFLLLSGEPFDARASIQAVYIKGAPAWQAPPQEELLALRAGKVYLGDGEILEPGVVIAAGGKILAAGRDLPIPPGARLVDRPEAVVTPGLIDADSRLGLHGTTVHRTQRREGGRTVVTGTERVHAPLRLGPDADPSAVVRVSEPGFAEAARNGVTAVVAAGEGGTGRGSLFKTAADADDKGLVSPVAALHAPVQDARSFLAAVAKAEAYRKSWDDHAKAYQEWRKKRFGPASRPAKPFVAPSAPEKQAEQPAKEAPKPAQTDPGPKPAPSSGDPVTGNWKGQVAGLPQGPQPVSLRLTHTDGKVTGMLQGPFRVRPNTPPILPLTGTFSGGKLELALKTREGSTVFELQAEISGNELKGSWELGGGRMKGTIEARRETNPSAPVWESVAADGNTVTLDEIVDIEDETLEVDRDLEESLERSLPPLPVPDLFLLAQGGDPLSGTWKGELEGLPGGRPGPFTLKLSLQGEQVTGTMQLPIGTRDGPREQELEGTFSGGTVRFRGKQLPMQAEATVGSDTMQGNWSLGPFRGTFTANRTEKPDAGEERKEEAPKAASASPDDPPPAPKLDPALEPWRAVLSGSAGLVLHGGDKTALAELLPVLREKHKLALLIVADSPAARENVELLARLEAAVLVRPGTPITPEWDGPAAFARAGVPVLFGSGSGEGTRWLALQAAYAVSRSMGPCSALQALTGWPARYLGAGERLGTLRPGRDADLVLWSGDPFDLTARVLLVAISGKVVFENE